MAKLVNKKISGINRFKVALGDLKQEISILRFSSKYKVSIKEVHELKKCCREAYYYTSYKAPKRNPI